MVIYGKPGQYSSFLAREARIRQTFFLVLLLTLALCVVYVTQTWGINIFFLAVSALFLGGFLGLTNQYSKKANRAKVGANAEKFVVEQLRKSKVPAKIFCGLLYKAGGDCDLTIVTQSNNVFAIEVKTGFGPVILNGRTITAGKRTIPNDAVGQIKRQVTALDKKNIWTTGVVVISEGELISNKYQSVDSTIVCTGRSLGSVLESLQAKEKAVPNASQYLEKLALEQGKAAKVFA